MAVKIAAFLITMLANIAAGAVILFLMLIVMNGFSGSDAEWGLGAYIILAIIVSILMSFGAVSLVRLLKKTILRRRIGPHCDSGVFNCGRRV